MNTVAPWGRESTVSAPTNWPVVAAAAGTDVGRDDWGARVSAMVIDCTEREVVMTTRRSSVE